MAGFVFILIVKTVLFILNVLDKIFRVVGFKPFKVTLENILTGLPPEAQAQASDPLVAEPLGLLVKGCVHDNRLSLFNRISIIQLLKRVLQTRAEIAQTIKDNPDILNTPIKKPVFIVGFPRTGTTLLYNLMAQDPQFRSPMVWEMVSPCPPGGKEDFRQDPRYKTAETILDIHHTSTGNASNVAHAIHADSYEECLPLLARVFVQIQYFIRIETLHELEDWFYKRPLQELVQSYEYHKLQLQIRGYKSMGNKTFLLKSPIHLGFTEPITRVYPDACLVFTYRRLGTVIPSLCSTLEKLTAAWGPPDALFGQRVLRMIGEFSNRMVSFVQKFEHLPPNKQPVYDLHYDTLVADPIAAVKSVYDHFGLTFSSEAENNMRAFLNENPQHKFGKHKYSLEEYGITEEDIKSNFSRYLKHYAPKGKELI